MTTPILQMGYLLLASPDPGAAARDLVNVAGLKITGHLAGAQHLSSNDRTCEIAYLPGPVAGVIAVGLEVADTATLEALKGRLSDFGLVAHHVDPPVPGVARALRVRSPFGPVFDLHTPVARDQGLHHVGPGSRMRRLEHVNLRVSDTRGLHDLLTGPMGMKLSDRTGALELAWYRAGDGFHHTIAAGQGNCLHHYAFEACAVDDLVRLADTLAALDRSLLWGLGRHGAGDNLFAYYRDPDGAAVECSLGMERIANDAIHTPRVWSLDPESRVRNQWEGSPPPPAFQQAGLPYL
jgi:catechol 2,3-dioxygenase-like lactoylglutathione lyase family enzyme